MTFAITVLAYCAVGLATRRLTRKSTFPFASFMMAGMLAALAAAMALGGVGVASWDEVDELGSLCRAGVSLGLWHKANLKYGLF